MVFAEIYSMLKRWSTSLPAIHVCISVKTIESFTFVNGFGVIPVSNHDCPWDVVGDIKQKNNFNFMGF